MIKIYLKLIEIHDIHIFSKMGSLLSRKHVVQHLVQHELRHVLQHVLQLYDNNTVFPCVNVFRAKN